MIETFRQELVLRRLFNASFPILQRKRLSPRARADIARQIQINTQIINEIELALENTA